MPATAAARLKKEMRDFALSLAGTQPKSPWPGHDDGVKLPVPRAAVLALPNAKPMGYGLGKSGWVSIRFEPAAGPPRDTIKRWVMESYRVQAPKQCWEGSKRANPALPRARCHADRRGRGGRRGSYATFAGKDLWTNEQRMQQRLTRYAAVAVGLPRRSNSRLLTHCCHSLEREPAPPSVGIRVLLTWRISCAATARSAMRIERPTPSVGRTCAVARLEISLPTHKTICSQRRSGRF